MKVLFILILITIFIFKNSLFYTIALLIITFLVLSYLALNRYLTFLSAFILIIVYVGAIIVLIGYICAISPNLVLEPSYNNIFILSLILFFIIIFDSITFSTFSLTTSTIVDYFYSYQGIYIFFVLVLILFITLLIVTSQYSVPRGPFRSVRV